MIVGDTVHGVEAVQVILEGDIVSPPSNDVEDGVVHFGNVHFFHKFVVHFERDFLFGGLGGASHGGEEITRGGKAVGTNGTEVGEGEVAVNFANVTSGW